jgi:SAM-dependent methyltransferase
MQARSAPAVARNRDPILEVLRRALPETGRVLEIASGTGEHIVHFARALPTLEWQPSDPSVDARQSISAWIAASGLTNIGEPLALDAASSDWPMEAADAILCINMVHISRWEATKGLMRGAGRLLGPGGLLYLYGPYRREGRHTAPSNAAFDADLRARNPEWGVRDLEEVAAEAAANGLALDRAVEMPANNLSLLFVKA